MNGDAIKAVPAQGAENSTRKGGARKRRITEVLPEMRDRIAPFFHKGVLVERIAEELDVSPLQLLEHVVREYVGAKHPGPMIVRKQGKPEINTVRAFRSGVSAA